MTERKLRAGPDVELLDLPKDFKTSDSGTKLGTLT